MEFAAFAERARAIEGESADGAVREAVTPSIARARSAKAANSILRLVE